MAKTANTKSYENAAIAAGYVVKGGLGLFNFLSEVTKGAIAGGTLALAKPVARKRATKKATPRKRVVAKK